MLKTVYELETAIYRGSVKEAELAKSIKQAKFNLREAKIAQVEYGGIRAFLDKLSGKHADKEEALSREVRKAEGSLNALLRQQEAETAELSSLREQRASLPPLEQLRTEENTELWAKLENRYCAACLLPLLDRVDEALSEYRQMLRGEFPVLSIERQQSIGAAPANRAEECRPLLQRLEAAGASIDPGAFFRSPAGFLAAAARHNQLDRAADAATQTRRLKAELTRLLQNSEE